MKYIINRIICFFTGHDWEYDDLSVCSMGYVTCKKCGKNDEAFTP